MGLFPKIRLVAFQWLIFEARFSIPDLQHSFRGRKFHVESECLEANIYEKPTKICFCSCLLYEHWKTLENNASRALVQFSNHFLIKQTTWNRRLCTYNHQLACCWSSLLRPPTPPTCCWSSSLRPHSGIFSSSSCVL